MLAAITTVAALLLVAGVWWYVVLRRNPPEYDPRFKSVLAGECPRCGGRRIFITRTREIGRYYASCANMRCESFLPIFFDRPEEALEAWNDSSNK